MAGLRPPLPLRRLHGPAQPAEPVSEGGGAPGTDRVIVTTPLTNTVRTTSTTQRDVTERRRSLAHDGRTPGVPAGDSLAIAGAPVQVGRIRGAHRDRGRQPHGRG